MQLAAHTANAAAVSFLGLPCILLWLTEPVLSQSKLTSLSGIFQESESIWHWRCSIASSSFLAPPHTLHILWTLNSNSCLQVPTHSQFPTPGYLSLPDPKVEGASCAADTSMLRSQFTERHWEANVEVRGAGPFKNL